MDFSIITPSYNMLSYLKRCRASVADQRGVSVEHIVADGGSTDGTVEWLRQRASDSALTFFSGKDQGMYDALNKGFALAGGKILAWLNCDEQYLEGTLEYVREEFDRHPRMDMLMGGALVVDPQGRLIAGRLAYPARRAYIMSSHLYNLSCAMFFRRTLWEDGSPFDTSLRDLGDREFVIRALENGFRARCVRRHLSVFCLTGTNMSSNENARREARRLRDHSPRWARALWLPLNVLRVAEKLLHGGYGRRPIAYAVYTEPDAVARQCFEIASAPSRWPKSR